MKAFCLFFTIVLISMYMHSSGFGFEKKLGNYYMEINGPAKINLDDIPVSNTINISGKMILHLPPSVKNVLIQKYNYPTQMFESELRTFTIQQALYWVVAILALGQAAQNR